MALKEAATQQLRLRFRAADGTNRTFIDFSIICEKATQLVTTPVLSDCVYALPSERAGVANAVCARYNICDGTKADEFCEITGVSIALRGSGAG
jgi:hypothetical protein